MPLPLPTPTPMTQIAASFETVSSTPSAPNTCAPTFCPSQAPSALHLWELKSEVADECLLRSELRRRKPRRRPEDTAGTELAVAGPLPIGSFSSLFFVRWQPVGGNIRIYIAMPASETTDLQRPGLGCSAGRRKMPLADCPCNIRR